MPDREKNKKGKLQVILLAIFVVFMPLGSWYYLQSGYNYNKSLMLELQDYGKVPAFTLINQNGDTVRNEDLLGNYFIADFYTAGSHSADATMDYAKRILEQFKTQERLYIVSHSLNPLNPSPGKLRSYAEGKGLDHPRAQFLAGSEEALLGLLSIGYKIPLLEDRKEDGSLPLKSNIGQLPREYPFLILVDSSMTIRNYYDVNEASVNKLVEHLAVILPRDKREKPELRPEKEK